MARRGEEKSREKDGTAGKKAVGRWRKNSSDPRAHLAPDLSFATDRFLPLFFLSYFNSLSSPLSNLLSQRQASSLEFRSFCISSDPLNPLLFERAREKDWNDIFKKVLQRCTPLMINRDFLKIYTYMRIQHPL